LGLKRNRKSDVQKACDPVIREPGDCERSLQTRDCPFTPAGPDGHLDDWNYERAKSTGECAAVNESNGRHLKIFRSFAPFIIHNHN
jgi:hypothetical protein